MKKLFVGSLAWATTDDSLKAFFSQVGQVESARVVFDKMSNRSKGFGFVEFSTEEEAKKAVDELNGKELDGRAINIDFARESADRPRREFGGGNRGGFRRN